MQKFKLPGRRPDLGFGQGSVNSQCGHQNENLAHYYDWSHLEDFSVCPKADGKRAQ